MKLKTIIPLSLTLLMGLSGQASGQNLPIDSIGDPKLHWANRIKIGGKIEVDGNYQSQGIGSSLSISTVELSMDVRLNTWSKARVVLLHEEDADQDVTLDEATITFGNTDEFPVYLKAGKMVVPFGNFSTQMLSDPLTMTMAEINENAIQAGFNRDGWNGSIYWFDGAAGIEDEENKVDQLGLHFGYIFGSDNWDLDVGLSYINSIESSNALFATLTNGVVKDYTAALGAHAVVMHGPYTMIGEYISAIDDLTASDRPRAWNAEVGFAFGFLGKEANVALGYQGTEEAEFIKMPEQRFLSGLSVALDEHALLGLEFHRDQGGYVSQNQTDATINSVTLRLAISF